jgi:hypothetical protein
VIEPTSTCPLLAESGPSSLGLFGNFLGTGNLSPSLESHSGVCGYEGVLAGPDFLRCYDVNYLHPIGARHAKPQLDPENRD